MRGLVVAILMISSVASAEVPLAIGVNAPFRWPDGDAIAVSGYAGLTEHQALHLNIASYANMSSVLADLATVFAGADGDEASRSGRTTDVGVGWMFYPGDLWSGFTVELGGFVRARNIRVEDDMATPQSVETHTKTLAGRALVGWSWTLGKHAFISVAAGLSAGYAWGRETTESTFAPMPVTTSVGRWQVAPEGFLRVGAVL